MSSDFLLHKMKSAEEGKGLIVSSYPVIHDFVSVVAFAVARRGMLIVLLHANLTKRKGEVFSSVHQDAASGFCARAFPV